MRAFKLQHEVTWTWFLGRKGEFLRDFKKSIFSAGGCNHQFENQ